MRAVVWVVAINLSITTSAAYAEGCGPVIDKNSVLSDAANAATHKMVRLQMYRKKMRGNTMFTSERCTAEERVIALYQRSLSFMEAHPECYNESDMATTRRIIKNDKEDLAFGCVKERPGNR